MSTPAPAATAACLPWAARPWRWARCWWRFRAKKLASVVGLKDKMNSFPRELSGGQIQRVAIARSLINSPEILLADEPTGNLDSENSDRVIEMLELIQKQTKMTLIVVTHNEQIAARADRIIRLKDGKIC